MLLGLCAMCSAKESIVVACMGEKLGQVRIENYSRRNSRVIDAHNNPISQMCLSADGTKLATASTRGTLIRIFDTHTGERLSEFRRGRRIYSCLFLFMQLQEALLLLSIVWLLTRMVRLFVWLLTKELFISIPACPSQRTDSRGVNDCSLYPSIF